MKGRLACVVLFCVFVTFASQAQVRSFGLGVILGEPTGLSGKAVLSERNAVDAAIAWSFRRNGHLHLHADYLWLFPHVIRSSEQFTLFAGLGGRIVLGRGYGVLGARIAGGISWLPRRSLLEIFLEVAPILDLVPATELSANGGLGIRLYF